MHGILSWHLKEGEEEARIAPMGKTKKSSLSFNSLSSRTVGITTNGLTLGRKLPRLREAGLDAVNISLDTLVAPKFEFITRRKGHDRVVRAVDQCVEAGMRVKVSPNNK